MGDVDEERRQLDARLAATQSALVVQEDTLKKSERERKALLEQVTALERNMTATENERVSLQVCVFNLSTIHYLFPGTCISND